MRIRVLTALAVLLLGVPEVAQEAAQPALHADRVLVLKKERTSGRRPDRSEGAAGGS